MGISGTLGFVKETVGFKNKGRLAAARHGFISMRALTCDTSTKSIPREARSVAIRILGKPACESEVKSARMAFRRSAMIAPWKGRISNSRDRLVMEVELESTTQVKVVYSRKGERLEWGPD